MLTPEENSELTQLARHIEWTSYRTAQLTWGRLKNPADQVAQWQLQQDRETYVLAMTDARKEFQRRLRELTDWRETAAGEPATAPIPIVGAEPT